MVNRTRDLLACSAVPHPTLTQSITLNIILSTVCHYHYVFLVYIISQT